MIRNTFYTIVKFLIVLFFTLLLCSCDSKKSVKPDIHGSWEAVDLQDTFFSFDENGRGFFDCEGTIRNFSYIAKEKTIEIKWEETAETEIWEYKVENKVLGLKNKASGEVFTCEKRQ
jgi:hypothetical protein